jgi:hypothetical protein
MRYRVCPRRALNNLDPGRIFYDSAYNLLIGSKSTFTADAFELMLLIHLSLYYVTRIKLALEREVLLKLIPLWISIFYSPKTANK